MTEFDQAAGQLASSRSAPADARAVDSDTDLLSGGFSARPNGFLIELSVSQPFGPDGPTRLDEGFELHLNLGLVDDPESDCWEGNPAPDWGGCPGDGVGGAIWSANDDGTEQIWLSQPLEEGPTSFWVGVVCRPQIGCPPQEVEITVFLDGVEVFRRATTRLTEHAMWLGATLDWDTRRARGRDTVITPPPGL